MDLKTEYFPTIKTARYSSYGKITAKTKYFWFALHGSHMTCEQMVYKFKDFDREEHFIVAPEGLSRFYAKGFSGDVVATWMTSRDRKVEIADFSEYLSSLFEHYQLKLPKTCQSILFGFSQGGTSIFRWLHRKTVKYNIFLAYSCWIPEDIDLGNGETKFHDIIYTYGKQDQYLTEDIISNLKSVVKINRLKPIILPYDGDHRVDKVQLKDIFEDNISKNLNI